MEKVALETLRTLLLPQFQWFSPEKAGQLNLAVRGRGVHGGSIKISPFLGGLTQMECGQECEMEYIEKSGFLTKEGTECDKEWAL